MPRPTASGTAVLLLVLATSCLGGANEANPLLVEQEVRRLLLPFQTQRGLVCDELLIEITANFNEMVTRPAVNTRSQRANQQIGDGFVEYQWVNLVGTLESHFLFRIVGAEGHDVALNEFAALQSVRLRVLEEGTLTFRITARGNVTVDEAGRQRNVQEFRIVDGRVEG